jgi:hypothetical protein
VSYDKFKNYTSATIDPMIRLNVVSKDHDLRSLDFSAFYISPGERLRPPVDVTLQFVVVSTNAWFRDHVRSLVLLVDGKRMDLGDLGWDRGDIISGMTEEGLSLDLPLRKFIFMVNSKQVQGQLGGTEFVLSEENLEALRDLASRMVSSAQSSQAATQTIAPEAPAVQTKYDAFKDTTTFTLRMNVSPDADMVLMQSCKGDVQGCVLTDPVFRNPGLSISGRTDDAPDVTVVYPLLFLVDGERLNLGNMGCKFAEFVGSRVQWQCYITPNVNDLLRVIHGSTVQAKIARWEFILTAEQLAAMKDFGRRLGYE